MKNSFEAEFEKLTNTDGSIDLVYKEATGFRSLAPLAILGGAIYFLSALGNAHTVSSQIFFGLIFAGYLCLAYLFLKSGFYKVTKKIKVIPGVGIEFDGKSVPFADITSIGHATFTSSPGKGYLYIKTRGVEVRIVEGLTAFVQGLEHEIINSSNVKFGN